MVYCSTANSSLFYQFAISVMTWLRRIRGRSRRERMRSEKTREELGAEETVIEKIQGRRLTWFGHVERMEWKRLPNAALHGHVRGERSRGRPGKRWMDNVREDLEERGIQPSIRNMEQPRIEKFAE